MKRLDEQAGTIPVVMIVAGMVLIALGRRLWTPPPSA